MRVGDLYRTLSFGELVSLAAAVDGTGTVRETKRPQLIQFANDALTRLHTHFLLREKTVLLELEEGVTTYPLVVGSPYIQDPDFTGDVIKIHGVFDSFGQVVPLNDPAQPFSLRTPQDRTLLVPKGRLEKVLEVVYQASHPTLLVDELDQEIELPVGLEEAFRAYIAARMYSAVGTAEAMQTGAGHMSRFQAILSDSEIRSWLEQGGSSENNKFANRGWV